MKVAYRQTGGAYSGAVINAIVTIGITGNRQEAIIQAFQNSGFNLVKQYPYSTWFSLAHVAGLQTSMAVVKATARFDYRSLLNVGMPGGPGYITVMFRFNTLPGLPASVIPVIAQQLAQYWSVGWIEPNYNPHRTSVAKREDEAAVDDHKTSTNSSTSKIYARDDWCVSHFSIGDLGKVDRYAGAVPETTSCEFHS